MATRNRTDIAKNLFFGILAQVLTLGLGIVLPKLYITSYGSEVNGLLSSIKQVFVYVALLEVGVGTATLQALYAPIATNNKKKICEILAATDHYYKRTGFFYALAIIVLAVIYPLVVSSDIPPGAIAFVIIFQGAAGVIKYFFQGKLSILLRVDGKNYVNTNALTLTTVFSDVVRITLMLLGFNVIAVQAGYFVVNLIQMIVIVRYVKKHYDWLDLHVTPDYHAIAQKNSALIHQVSGLVFNNTDILLLTFVCGFNTVSVYAIYAIFFSIVGSFVDTICGSIEFRMGQIFNTNIERFKQMQETFETYYLAFSFALFTVTVILINPFLSIYAEGITDIGYIDKYLPFLFLGVSVLTYARRSSSQIINFAGHFKQTRWRSILETCINITVSLICVFKFGIYGVLLGTIAALLYRTNDFIIYANVKILHRRPHKTYRRWIVNLLLMVGCIILSGFINPESGSYIEWFLTAAPLTIVVLLIFVIVDSAFDYREFLKIKATFIGVIRNKIDKIVR